jgi:molecular chaperone DnaK (HSP70)
MWALDLGNTNTVLARWDGASDRPTLLALPGLSRRTARVRADGGSDEAAAGPSSEAESKAIPSALHLLDRPSWPARLFGLGPLALIGRPALEKNAVRPRPGFVPSFKRELGLSPLHPLARAGGRVYTAREVARLYLRELFAEVKRETGEKIRALVITTPVEAFEPYRAELASAARGLGVRKLSFIDEPVAAALGYGLGLSRPRRVLVVDFGGSTLHLALVRTQVKDVAAGRTEVLAKVGRAVGGDLVDRWLLAHLCAKQGLSFDDAEDAEAQMWRRLARAEACRVKESLYFADAVVCELPPPRAFQRPGQGTEALPQEVRRADLVLVLAERGLFSLLQTCLDELLRAAAARGLTKDDIDDVVLVGGSTLLPEVYSTFERAFGRDRVRAWQPFEAVAYGACVYAAGRAEPADFIVHDYALLTHGLESTAAAPTVIVPRGTPFPTRSDLWKGQLVPTCARGEPEQVFKLVICELAEAGANRSLAWDEAGRPHKLDGAAQGLLVKLNEANPALGRLDPPHSPRDQAARLEVSFGVNASRWLCATVVDLKTRKLLLRDEPVVRLL